MFVAADYSPSPSLSSFVVLEWTSAGSHRNFLHVSVLVPQPCQNSAQVADRDVIVLASAAGDYIYEVLVELRMSA